MQETWVQSLGREDPLEKEMTPHLSTLAWEIPWTEEPGGATVHGGHKRVRHNLVTERRPQMVTAALLTTASSWNQVNVHRQMNR